MSPEEWLKNQKLGWCRQNAWITEAACSGRRKAQLKRHDGPRDFSGAILLGCELCPDLDYDRERDNSPDPVPLPAEPLPISIIIKEPVMPKPTVLVAKPKVRNTCKVSGCHEYVTRLGLCRGHLVEMGLDPKTGLPVKPLDVAAATATSEQMGTTLERLGSSIEPGGAAAMSTDPRVTFECPHCHCALSSAEVEDPNCPSCERALHTHLLPEGEVFTPVDSTDDGGFVVEPRGSLNSPEPPPVHNDHPPVWNLVMVDMLERDRIGAKKYGTRLQPHNGRDFLIDAYQELLDGAVYLRGLLYERDGR